MKIESYQKIFELYQRIPDEDRIASVNISIVSKNFRWRL